MGHVLIALLTDFDVEMVHPPCDTDALVQGVAAPLAALTIKQADFVFGPPAAMVDPAPQVIGMALQAGARWAGPPRPAAPPVARSHSSASRQSTHWWEACCRARFFWAT